MWREPSHNNPYEGRLIGFLAKNLWYISRFEDWKEISVEIVHHVANRVNPSTILGNCLDSVEIVQQVYVKLKNPIIKSYNKNLIFSSGGH